MALPRSRGDHPTWYMGPRLSRVDPAGSLQTNPKTRVVVANQPRVGNKKVKAEFTPRRANGLVHPYRYGYAPC